MRKNMTIKDIAKKAGVAHSTVSLVMNKKGYVSEKLRKKILKTAKDLGYEPNIIARGLISRKFPVIAAVFPENPRFFSITYFLKIIGGIQDACKDTGNALMLFNLNQTKGESYYQVTRKWLTNQIILMNIDYTRDIQEDIQVLKKNKIAFVLINKYFGKEDVSYICVDNYNGVYQVIEHLVSLGHKDIGLINGDLKTPDGQERFYAFKKILKEFNLKFNPDFVYYGGYFDFPAGEKAADEFLNRKVKPTAVFSASDNMAISFIRVLKAEGYNIPRDLSIVGFDDSIESSYITPRLTTVKQPLVQIGQEAAKLVMEQSDKNDFAPRHIVLRTDLIIRESTSRKLKSSS